MPSRPNPTAPFPGTRSPDSRARTGIADPIAPAVPGRETASGARASWYVRLMTGDKGARFADEDPEYATDAAAEIDVEVTGSAPEDPKNVPADKGDSGTAEPPAGGG